MSALGCPFFGFCDLALFAVLIFLDYLFRRKGYPRPLWLAIAVCVLLFGFALPFLSIAAQTAIVKHKYPGEVDSFNLMYTVLRFPLYWLIGAVQIVILVINRKWHPGKGRQR